MTEKRYMVKECFYSLQGEGVRAGTPNVFLRFSGCNLCCSRATHGFDCDTDFSGGDKMTASEIVDNVVRQDRARCGWVILTGGEPALQIDQALVGQLRQAGYRLAIETNGTRSLPKGIDWVCVSPKFPGPPIAVHRAQELKVVLHAGQPLPNTLVEADHYLVSPAFEEVPADEGATSDGLPPAGNLRWCVDLCLNTPPWRLSVQQHKLWGLP